MLQAGLNRRSFLSWVPALAGAGLISTRAHAAAAQAAPGGGLPDVFPRLDPQVVRAFVGVCHSNLDEARRLVERQPSLARASWDWGFGDWETGLGAAAHVGRREIAQLVLAHGARPTIFSAAMLGQLDVVRAFVAANPGIQGTLGPHAITLLAHARAGGPDAAAVVAYLEGAGGADVRPATQPLAPADRDAIVGRYTFGPGPREYFNVNVRNDRPEIERPESTRGFLFHTGDLVFFPSGVPSVKIAFAREGARVTRLTIADPDVFVTATREP
ncbi:MAG: hypothetical protein Q8L86_14295 [Vicinamibacterales bacterium]|nr:hypothetical protein [Vicinamibacterales bacterium]